MLEGSGREVLPCLLVDSPRGDGPYLETGNSCGRYHGNGMLTGLPPAKASEQVKNLAGDVQGGNPCMCVMYRQHPDITTAVLGLKISCAGSKGGRQE